LKKEYYFDRIPVSKTGARSFFIGFGRFALGQINNKYSNNRSVRWYNRGRDNEQKERTEMLTYLTFLDTNEDKEHFILLYEVYHRQLYYVAFRILGKKEEAEDGVQEMYLRLVKYIDRIDVGVYPILKTYLKERGESAELMFTDFLKMQEKRKQKKVP